MDCRHRRLLHVVDVQARSLRVSGRAGALPPVCPVLARVSGGTARCASSRRARTVLDDVAEARAFFAGAEPFYCAMLKPAFDEFVAQGVPLEIAHERDGMWATSGRALWRRKIPPTRFVVVTRAQSAVRR